MNNEDRVYLKMDVELCICSLLSPALVCQMLSWACMTMTLIIP